MKFSRARFQNISGEFHVSREDFIKFLASEEEAYNKKYSSNFRYPVPIHGTIMKVNFSSFVCEARITTLKSGEGETFSFHLPKKMYRGLMLRYAYHLLTNSVELVRYALTGRR